ncbi:DMT family transporter [Yinghuangia soli]|uniref:DMT family transporter n=1 Tax=Yinghuangia soli TaxID=2908204 RepID=A0AA41U144_9ACTN|nr:DMT family transporter [Yinghuangia soli]MCF2527117.1 DMT family transporter [Yinghuangia soli]
MTITLALLTSVLWGLADFGAGLLTRRMAAARVVVLSQSAAVLVLGAVVLATGAFSEAGPRLWFAAAAGVVGPLALLCFYSALARGPMGVVSPLATAGVFIPVSIGLAVDGDRPGLLQYAGIAVAIAGIAMAGGLRLGGAAIQRKTLMLTMGSALGFGTVFALVAEASTTVTGLFLALFVQRCVNVVVGGAALAVTERRARAGGGKSPAPAAGPLPAAASAGSVVATATLPVAAARAERRPWPWKLALALTAVGIADVAANGTYASAAQHGPVTVAAVLASLYPVITSLAARGFLKERLETAQAVGAGLALAGTVLLAAG